MKFLKYIFFFMLLFPLSVFALHDSGNESGIDWVFDDGTLTFSTNDDKINYRIVKPYSPSWTVYNDQVDTIVIMDGIDIIADHAFENFTNLESVIFPKSMGGYLGDYSFYNCTKLKHVDLPIGILKIGSYAFYGSAINEVEVPIYCDWFGENAFNENTTILRPKEYENIIAAGTCGPTKQAYSRLGCGTSGDNTCYIKAYYSDFYDDTAYWKLDKEGTLTIWGTELVSGYFGSRNPWGCYKNQIKNIVINDDKTGVITLESNKCNNISDTVVAVYSSLPVEDIMSRRIREIPGLYYLGDCREDCIYGYRNLNTIRVNRGVEKIGSGTFYSITIHPKDIYINKYVKEMDDTYVFMDSSQNLEKQDNENNFHLEVSYEDYLNNNYSYMNLVGENGFEIINNNGMKLYGNLINDIDNYVSINDNTAPKTIESDGNTYYLYETYKSDSNGKINISIPNDDRVNYVAKVINPPNNCRLNKKVHIINMKENNIVLNIAEEDELINPKTNRNIIFVLVIVTMLFGLLLIRYKKINS